MQLDHPSLLRDAGRQMGESDVGDNHPEVGESGLHAGEGWMLNGRFLIRPRARQLPKHVQPL